MDEQSPDRPPIDRAASEPVRLRATLTVEYDARPEHYDCEPTPEAMAALDEQHLTAHDFADIAEEGEGRLIVRPVEREVGS